MTIKTAGIRGRVFRVQLSAIEEERILRETGARPRHSMSMRSQQPRRLPHCASFLCPQIPDSGSEQDLSLRSLPRGFVRQGSNSSEASNGDGRDADYATDWSREEEETPWRQQRPTPATQTVRVAVEEFSLPLPPLGRGEGAAPATPPAPPPPAYQAASAAAETPRVTRRNPLVFQWASCCLGFYLGLTLILLLLCVFMVTALLDRRLGLSLARYLASGHRS